MVENNKQLPTRPPSSTKKHLLPYLLTALVILAFVGLIFFRPSHKNNSGNSSSATKVVIPKDWKTYKAEKYGFSFSYPKNWSNPNITDRSKNGSSDYQITFVANNNTIYSVVAYLQNGSPSTVSALSIQKNLTGDKKDFLKSDSSSYSNALSDSKTNSLAQVNLFQVVSLPNIKVSAVMTEALLNPTGSCPGSQLAPDETSGCFTDSDYKNLSLFAKSFSQI
jgi:hypothetical protein